MKEKYCFVAVEFINDLNVVGLKYWYICTFDGAEVGDLAYAPLGRHNNCQTGIVREVTYATLENAPYPVNMIKSVKKLTKREQEE